MKKHIIASVLITILLSSETISALGGVGAISTNQSITSAHLTNMDDVSKASPDIVSKEIATVNTEENTEDFQMQEYEVTENAVTFEVNGKKVDHLSIYMKRNPETNKVILPQPTKVTIQQKSGSPIGKIDIVASSYLNADRERIRVEVDENIVLSLDSPVVFYVSFIDQNIGDKNDIPNGTNDKFYIQIISESGFCKKLALFYGADGLYTHYSAEYIDYYKGTTINKKYVNIGEVNLNQTVTPFFTIEHYYKAMTGAESAIIREILLDPNGAFIFDDGTYIMELNNVEEGWISIPITMKEKKFEELRNNAISKNEAVNIYSILKDMVIAYDDGYDGKLGYMAGGTVAPLPLVYHITYTPDFLYISHNSGGSGSSSGSGGSGGSGSAGGTGSSNGPGSSATITKPEQVARTTIASEHDIGWTQINGQYYYIDTHNQWVTDWLKCMDGKWYYFGSDGILKTGWCLVDEKWYFFNSDGSMAVGLTMINQQWYLLKSDGSMAIGWAQDPDGNWRYFFNNGLMATNYKTPDGKYVNESGVWIS